MAKFLDGNGLGYVWGLIKEHVSTAVATAKATIDAYTINGKKISGNPTITKSDLGLGNVTNDAQVKRTEMGKANGVMVTGNYTDEMGITFQRMGRLVTFDLNKAEELGLLKDKGAADA